MMTSKSLRVTNAKGPVMSFFGEMKGSLGFEIVSIQLLFRKSAPK